MLLKRLLLAVLLMTASAPAAHADEYRDALDRFMITELMYRYAIAHNTADIEGYANLFTDDAVLYDAKMGFEFARGRAAIIKAAEKDRDHYNPDARAGDGMLHLSSLRHVVTNPVVTLTGRGAATGICYLQMIANKPGYGPVLLSLGYYRDHYVKRGRKWLISRRDFYTVDWSNWGLARELGLVNGPAPDERK